MRTEEQGILVVNKDRGLTSHDVVAKIRRIFNMRRVGHCGTLDPLATGVLVVCLGRLTRLNEWIARADKEYITTFCLGATSDTWDADGQICAVETYTVPSVDQVASALAVLTGSYDQVPPAFSAIKVNGVPSYRLARQNKAVELKARRITITAIELLEYSWPNLRVRIACSKGTYIRSVARDLGEKLGCGAYVAALHRTSVGALNDTGAWTVQQIEDRVSSGQEAALFIPPAQCLNDLPHLVLEPFQLKRFGSGQGVSLAACRSMEKKQTYAVFDQDQRLYGIGHWEQGDELLKPVKVFQQAC